MRARAMAVVVLAMALGYAAAPYVTLYRLDRALRSGDAAYVNAHVDWPSLRDGLVAQIDRAVTGQAAPRQDDTELPAFGSGFVHGMATRMVDQAIERDAMMSRLRNFALASAAPAGASAVPAHAPGPDRALQWACFDGPTSFHVELSIGDDPASQPVRLEMQLRGGEWQITQASVPPTMLLQAASRT